MPQSQQQEQRRLDGFQQAIQRQGPLPSNDREEPNRQERQRRPVDISEDEGTPFEEDDDQIGGEHRRPYRTVRLANLKVSFSLIDVLTLVPT